MRILGTEHIPKYNLVSFVTFVLQIHVLHSSRLLSPYVSASVFILCKRRIKYWSF